MSVLYLIGFIQSIFVSSLVLLKKKKIITDYILSLYILVMGFFLVFTYAQQNDIYTNYPIILVLDILYWVWIGPLLFIYIDLSTSPTKKLQVKHLIHLLPTFFVLSGFIDFFTDTSVTYIENYESDSWYVNLCMYIWYYNSPVYYLICIYKLIQHKRKTKNYYSNITKVDLNWLFYLVNGFAAYLIIGLILGLLRMYAGIDLPFGSYHYTWLVMVIYIFGMGYYGFHQKGIFTPIYQANEENATPPEKTIRLDIKNPSYLKSGLKQDEIALILNKLKDLMENEKPYLDSELTLRDLSEKLNTTPHKLSQLINEQLKQNFFEYINDFRIKEVKQALINSEFKNLKVMAIAYDCGFNSKSTFYTLFKKATKQTPTQYRNKKISNKMVV